MKDNDKYYENFIDAVYKIIKNKVKYKYDLGYCIVQGTKPHTYQLQSLKLSTTEEKKNNPQMMEIFINDLREHLFNNKPFKILPKEASYYINSGFDYDELFSNLIRSFFNAARDKSTKEVIPSFKQFEKTLNCFSPILNSISNLFDEVYHHNEYIGDDFDKYFYTILSLENNYQYYLGAEEEYIGSNIDDEIKNLADHYLYLKEDYEEEDYDEHGNLIPGKVLMSKLIKPGLINYFTKRKDYLLKITNQDENIDILQKIKYILDPKDWKEISLYLPNLISHDNSEDVGKNLIEINNKPIFQFNVNIRNCLNNSPTIVTNKDLYETTTLIANSLNDTKPEGIDYVEALHLKQGIILILSGDKLNQDYASNICNIFEKMVSEYNSDNINKILNKNDEDIEGNKKYLDKAAETYWLESELCNTNINTNSKRKVKKI